MEKSCAEDWHFESGTGNDEFGIPLLNSRSNHFI